MIGEKLDNFSNAFEQVVDDIHRRETILTCPNCQSRVNEGQRKCGKCGHEIVNKPQ